MPPICVEDLHDLFLVGHDAVGLAEDGLEGRVRVLDRGLAVLAHDEVVDHAAAEGPGAIERLEGDDVAELVGLQAAQEVAEAR